MDKIVQKSFHWLIDNIEFILAIFAMAYIFLNSSFSANEVATHLQSILFTLIALSFFVMIRLYRLGNTTKSISDNCDILKNKLPTSIEATVLYDRESCYRKLNEVLNADSFLDTTYFTETPPTFGTGHEEKEYWKKHESYLKSNNNKFQVRRIVTIENKEKLEWVKSMLPHMKEFGKLKIKVLLVGPQPFPLLNVIIIDSQYTMLFGPHDTDTRQQYIFIDSSTVASSFNQYFTSLWQAKSLILNDQCMREFDTDLNKTIEIIADLI